ncbi:unnamed protein product [Allacma fusca]|uniref:Uncharacterized protein n=1 Tax=Allacma fusca TaxID=39272 RepID=A0A8J2NL92_9HEXA|nr:unnamed protein product [Allacma fusca]
MLTEGFSGYFTGVASVESHLLLQEILRLLLHIAARARLFLDACISWREFQVPCLLVKLLQIFAFLSLDVVAQTLLIRVCKDH